MAPDRNSAGQSAAQGSSSAFLTSVGLPHLLRGQNPDGGWGFRAGAASSVEATSWVLLGLKGLAGTAEVERARSRGLAWLTKTQLADGSWPAFPDQDNGIWVTSLACMALLAHDASPQAVRRGVRWLCHAWPAEGRLFWRLLYYLRRGTKIVRQSPAYRGWSWTPGTSSWVEPTALTLLLLQRLPADSRPRPAAKRIRLAEAMLYDRMCPGGGWNCGNPLVYGVAGVPAVGPTVWALLALRAHAKRSENRQGLGWLEAAYPRTQGPGSLALAQLCLRAYDRPAPEPELETLYATNQFLGSTVTLAWVALALGPARDWLLQIPSGQRVP